MRMKVKDSNFWTLIDLNSMIVVRSFQDECLKHCVNVLFILLYNLCCAKASE